MKKLLLSLVAGLAAIGASAASTVDSWSFKTSQSFGSPMTMKTATTGTTAKKGTWTFTYTIANSGTTQNDGTNGPRFGSSGKALNAGSALVLSNSDIAANAKIEEVNLTVKGNANASACEWQLKVNGTVVTPNQSMRGTNTSTLSWSNLNVTGNQIELSVVSCTAGIHLVGVDIKYDNGATTGGGDETTLGDIVATYNGTAIEAGSSVTVSENYVIEINAENADKIEAKYNSLITTFTEFPASWKLVNACQNVPASIVAYRGTESKTLDFTLTVNAKTSGGEEPEEPVTTSSAQFIFGGENANISSLTTSKTIEPLAESSDKTAANNLDGVTITNGIVSVEFSTGSNTNNVPRWFVPTKKGAEQNPEARVYNSNTFTIAVAGDYKITSIEFVQDYGTTWNTVSTGNITGTWDTNTAKTKIWTPAADEVINSVVMTPTGTVNFQTLTVKYAPTVTSAIEEVEAVESGVAEWYDLQGRRVVAPAKGIYIRRQGNTATKVRF